MARVEYLLQLRNVFFYYYYFQGDNSKSEQDAE